VKVRKYGAFMKSMMVLGIVPPAVLMVMNRSLSLDYHT
jgi:hypothetical protein